MKKKIYSCKLKQKNELSYKALVEYNIANIEGNDGELIMSLPYNEIKKDMKPEQENSFMSLGKISGLNLNGEVIELEKETNILPIIGETRYAGNYYHKIDAYFEISEIKFIKEEEI